MEQNSPAVGAPVEPTVRRRRAKQPAAPKTLGQVAHAVVYERAGGKAWHELLEAEVEDWELAAAAVARQAIETLQVVRQSLVKIGAHPQSFWDTCDDVERIDSLLARWGAKAAAMDPTPNVL